MAKKQAIKPKASKSNDASKDLDIYEHKGSKRLNNPQVGLVNTKTEKVETKKTYKFDPHLDPQLQWAGKEEKQEIEVSTVSLHVHERIDSRTIIEAVKKTPETLFKQLNLFNRPINKLNFIKEIQFYQHEKDWSNRMIAGDSALVINSLLEKEAMAGKVQMIFMDPPYGIKYSSNFQPFTNKKPNLNTDKDEDLTIEPEMLKAFRDTWELGLHSYLSYVRERVSLGRTLLTESGSIFFQISDANLFYVQAILSEIFGQENFCAIIPFRKKTWPMGAKVIEQMSDYLIWYCKDKSKVKYNTLYTKKSEEPDNDWSWYELADKTRHKMTRNQIDGIDQLPKGARIYRLRSLEPSGINPSGMYEFEFDGKLIKPPKKGYSIDLDGLNRLKALNRLQMKGNILNFVWFKDDFMYSELTAPWFDTVGAKDKTYVVQTSPEVVKRCMLMTTSPGDLVLDPTCGSGTTAMVAETYGRRWITCDSSRIALQLAKQRIMTSTFPYYALKYPEEGVSSGFVYESVPRKSAKDLAYGQAGQVVELIDLPKEDNSKVRVSGPFTVEAVPAPVVQDISEISNRSNVLKNINDWIAELLKSGIRLNNKKFLKLSRLEPMQGTRWLHAEGETQENPPQKIVVSFGPDFAPLEQRQVELALQEAEKIKPSPTVIVFTAFQFDPEASKDIDEVAWGGVSVLKALMNADLYTEDLKKKRTSNESFWMVGQPDIEIEKIKSEENKGNYKVCVNGFDYYNTISGSIESGGANKIAMWMLDTDYDGRSLLPKQVFFPQAGDNEGWAKLSKSLRAEIDEDLIEAYRGTESLPFEIGENKKIAVKIIDDRGIESLVVRDLE